VLDLPNPTDTRRERRVSNEELFNEEHEAFRDTVRRFIENEIAPHHAQWEDSVCAARAVLEAGAAGLLCCTVPEQYGGAAPTTCST